MELDRFIEDIHAQLDAAAQAGGEEARELADRLAAPLDSAIRLALQDALAAAAEEITVELAPGSVELRLRGREPIFVVTPPEPIDERADGDGDDDEALGSAAPPPGIDGDDPIARINVRMPEHLKARVDRAAEREGLSINAWLVRAAAARLERAEGQRGREHRAP
ncbi:MAG: toxin-antitoxin system HicB family antitoxin, partial [Actinomycetota bacterium]